MESMPSMSRLMKIIHVEEGSQREKKKKSPINMIIVLAAFIFPK